MAFQAVRIQQSVVEFILNHTEQIFSSDCALIKPKEGKKEGLKNVMTHHLNEKHTFTSCRSDVCGEVRHTSHKWSEWTDEADEPGGGPGPLLEPQPSRAQGASAGEQSAGHQHRHALPHGHRHRQQVGTRRRALICELLRCTIETFRRFFMYQEEAVRKIKEMEVHLQPGTLSGLKGKTEP